MLSMICNGETSFKLHTTHLTSRGSVKNFKIRKYGFIMTGDMWILDLLNRLRPGAKQQQQQIRQNQKQTNNNTNISITIITNTNSTTNTF